MATDRQKRAKAAAARQKAARSQKNGQKAEHPGPAGRIGHDQGRDGKKAGPTVSAVEVRDLFASVGAVDRVASPARPRLRRPTKSPFARRRSPGPPSRNLTAALDGRPLRVALKGGRRRAAARVVVDVAAKAARTARPSKPVVVDLGGPRRPKKQRGKTAVRKPPKSKKARVDRARPHPKP